MPKLKTIRRSDVCQAEWDALDGQIQYRVHIGYTRNGRNRWVYYPSLEAARRAINEVFARTKTMLCDEEIKRYCSNARTVIDYCPGRAFAS
jgi:hypothetical protein